MITVFVLIKIITAFVCTYTLLAVFFNRSKLLYCHKIFKGLILTAITKVLHLITLQCLVVLF